MPRQKRESFYQNTLHFYHLQAEVQICLRFLGEIHYAEVYPSGTHRVFGRTASREQTHAARAGLRKWIN
jgi:hypothetical protein